MKSPEELEKIRQAYLDGTQERDEHGDRLWWIESWDWWAPDENHNFKLWEVYTAEGPTITAMKDMDTGKSRIQVNDGSPERSDACAERFTFNMEWSMFVAGWVSLADAIARYESVTPIDD